MTEEEMYQAVCRDDAAYDGVFYFGVTSTGIFCYPSCPSRKPRRDHFRVFRSRDEAVADGFRPCKRCWSEQDGGRTQYARDLAARVLALADAQLATASVTNLAAAVGMSHQHLQRLFKQATGCTLHEQIVRRRVERAASLLQTTQQSVLEIAAAVGFENISTCYAAFHRVLGAAPGEYRKQQQEALPS